MSEAKKLPEPSAKVEPSWTDENILICGKHSITFTKEMDECFVCTEAKGAVPQVGEEKIEMTREEHLLLILAEECAEVAHRVSKALRFGVMEVEPGQELTNGCRIAMEVDDLYAMVEMLREGHLIPGGSDLQRKEKKAKVEKYLAYSSECGTLESSK